MAFQSIFPEIPVEHFDVYDDVRVSLVMFLFGTLFYSISFFVALGYLGSSPDPGCQLPASTSPKFGKIF